MLSNDFSLFVVALAVLISSFASFRDVDAQDEPLFYQVNAINGPEDGYNSMTAIRILESGAVVGTITDFDGNNHAFVERDGTFSYLGDPSVESQAFGASDSGLIVGSKTLEANGSEYQRAVFWYEGQETELEAITAGGFGQAFAANEKGEIVGRSQATESGEEHATLWRDGEVIDLGTLDGALSSALSINESSQIVGWSSIGTSTDRASITFRAFLWEAGVLTDLGTLGGDLSIAYSINESGSIVGDSSTEPGVPASQPRQKPFLWKNGKMKPFDNDRSRAGVIRDDGVIVGGRAGHATIWINGDSTDLNHVNSQSGDFVLEFAADINSDGAILARNEYDQYLRLTPALQLLPTPTPIIDYQYAATLIAAPEGTKILVAGVSDDGVVAGTVIDSGGIGRGFTFSDGEFTYLTDESQRSSWLAISGNGNLAGILQKGNATQSIVWKDGTAVELELLVEDGFSGVGAVNNHGEVAGFSDYGSEMDAQRATLWRDGKAIELGTLGGSNSFAYGINDKGQVVGTSQTEGDGGMKFFIWADGEMTALDFIDGGTTSIDINNNGQIMTQTTTGITIWEGETGVRLDVSGAESVQVLDFNDSGSIVGRYSGPEFSGAALWVDGKLMDVGAMTSGVEGDSLWECSGISNTGLLVCSGDKGAYLLTPLS